MARLTQLEDWSNNPAEIPKCTFLSYLVNPQSFLTAVNQVAAQKNQWELDKLVSFSDVTRYATFDKVEAVSREGAYITGLNMQGARWDVSNAVIDRSKPKEMFCAMPVMLRGMPAKPETGSEGFHARTPVLRELTRSGLRPVCSAHRAGEQMRNE